MFLLLSFISRQTIRVIVKIEGEIILLSELIHPALIIKQRLCQTKRIEFDYKSLSSNHFIRVNHERIIGQHRPEFLNTFYCLDIVHLAGGLGSGQFRDYKLSLYAIFAGIMPSDN